MLLFFLFQVSGLGLLPSLKVKIFLQLLNTVVMLAAVWFLFLDASHLSFSAEAWTTFGVVSRLLILIKLFDRDGQRRICLMTQYVVVALVLIQLRYISEMNLAVELASLPGHFLMGLRALFLGPLGLFAISLSHIDFWMEPTVSCGRCDLHRPICNRTDRAGSS